MQQLLLSVVTVPGFYN